MSIFASIKGSIGKIAYSPVNPLNLLTAAVAKPLSFIAHPLQTSKQVLQQSNKQTITQVVSNTAVAAAGVAAFPSAAARLASSSLVTKAAAVSAGLVAAPVVIGSEKARQAIEKTPSSLSNIGQNTANFIQNPSVNSATKIIKDNPVVTGIAAGIAGIAIAKTVVPPLTTYLNTQAIQENTGAARNPPIIELPKQDTDDLERMPIIVQVPQNIPLAQSSPVVAPTQAAPGEVSIKTENKPVKKAKKKKKSKSKRKRKTRRSKKKTSKRRNKKKKSLNSRRR